MSKLLLLGTGPLLEETGARLVSGQCLRTLHFARPLLEAGHRVSIATVPIPGTETTPEKFSYENLVLGTESKGDGDRNIPYTSLGCSAEHLVVPFIQNKLQKNRYDAIIGVNPWPACLVAKASPQIPFWADLNGYTMAEGQTRSRRVGHDRDMMHFWKLEMKTLLMADRFSTVTQRQAWALMGELAMAGRFLSSTFREEFTVSVPNAIYTLYANLDRIANDDHESRKTILERLLGDSVPSDAPVVLWSGGFNTWTDIDLLTDALDQAMQENADFHFIATGGAVSGHDDVTFKRFQEMVADRLPAERVHLLGWVDTADVLDLHRMAHVGINVDSQNTETMFGARNRLTNMIGCGMPVLTTKGTEIAEWMTANNVGITTPIGDAESYARAILEFVTNADDHEKRAAANRELALQEFAPARTLEKFLQWCESPEKSSDHGPKLIESEITNRMNHILDGSTDQWAEDSVSLRLLRNKLPIRVYRQIRKVLRGK